MKSINNYADLVSNIFQTVSAVSVRKVT